MITSKLVIVVIGWYYLGSRVKHVSITFTYNPGEGHKISLYWNCSCFTWRYWNGTRRMGSSLFTFKNNVCEWLKPIRFIPTTHTRKRKCNYHVEATSRWHFYNVILFSLMSATLPSPSSRHEHPMWLWVFVNVFISPNSLTHWLRGFVAVLFPHSLYRIIAWTLTVKFLLSKCRRTSLIRSQHWFMLWLGAVRQQATIWANIGPDLCRHVASLGHNVLEPQCVKVYYIILWCPFSKWMSGTETLSNLLTVT